MTHDTLPKLQPDQQEQNSQEYMNHLIYENHENCFPPDSSVSLANNDQKLVPPSKNQPTETSAQGRVVSRLLPKWLDWLLYFLIVVGVILFVAAVITELAVPPIFFFLSPLAIMLFAALQIRRDFSLFYLSTPEWEKLRWWQGPKFRIIAIWTPMVLLSASAIAFMLTLSNEALKVFLLSSTVLLGVSAFYFTLAVLAIFLIVALIIKLTAKPEILSSSFDQKNVNDTYSLAIVSLEATKNKLIETKLENTYILLEVTTYYEDCSLYYLKNMSASQLIGIPDHAFIFDGTKLFFKDREKLPEIPITEKQVTLIHTFSDKLTNDTLLPLKEKLTPKEVKVLRGQTEYGTTTRRSLCLVNKDSTENYTIPPSLLDQYRKSQLQEWSKVDSENFFIHPLTQDQKRILENIAGATTINVPSQWPLGALNYNPLKTSVRFSTISNTNYFETADESKKDTKNISL